MNEGAVKVQHELAERLREMDRLTDRYAQLLVEVELLEIQAMRHAQKDDPRSAP